MSRDWEEDAYALINKLTPCIRVDERDDDRWLDDDALEIVIAALQAAYEKNS